MRKLIIIEIDTDVVRLASEDGIKFEIGRTKLPEDIEIGDELFLIEHRRYDIYSSGVNRYMKKGLVPLTEMKRIRE